MKLQSLGVPPQRQLEQLGSGLRRVYRLPYQTPTFFLATVLPHNIGMPNCMSCKLLFRSRNYAQHRITRQETLQPTTLRADTNGLANRPVAYRLARMTAIRIGWPVTACSRMCEFALNASTLYRLFFARI